MGYIQSILDYIYCSFKSILVVLRLYTHTSTIYLRTNTPNSNISHSLPPSLVWLPLRVGKQSDAMGFDDDSGEQDEEELLGRQLLLWLDAHLSSQTCGFAL